MKPRWLIAAVLFQIWMAFRCPSGLGMESVLAGRAWADGILPYSGFKMHIGPVLPAIFAGLFSVPSLVWCSLVFGAFNLGAAWQLWRLSGSAAASALFLVVLQFFDGNAWHAETAMTFFGVAGVRYGFERRWIPCWGAFALAALTKQSGAIYPAAFVLGRLLC